MISSINRPMIGIERIHSRITPIGIRMICTTSQAMQTSVTIVVHATHTILLTQYHPTQTQVMSLQPQEHGH